MLLVRFINYTHWTQNLLVKQTIFEWLNMPWKSLIQMWNKYSKILYFLLEGSKYYISSKYLTELLSIRKVCRSWSCRSVTNKGTERAHQKYFTNSKLFAGVDYNDTLYKYFLSPRWLFVITFLSWWAHQTCPGHCPSISICQHREVWYLRNQPFSVVTT